MKINLTFGSMAAPLVQQLGVQGINAPTKLLDHWQKDADAISRLAVRGFLTDTETNRARRRLLQTILRRSAARHDGDHSR
jgi:hypothetical protein